MNNIAKFILFITGPTGAGKSTVASQLAKQLNNSVNINIDQIKHFIVNNFLYDESSEGVKQWQLLGQNISLLANSFQHAGYNVIIDGYIGDFAWKILSKNTRITHKVLLLPHEWEVVRRDSLRDVRVAMGKKAVNEHHNYFSNSSIYDDFVKIDSAGLTCKETVNKIASLID